MQEQIGNIVLKLHSKSFSRPKIGTFGKLHDCAFRISFHIFNSPIMDQIKSRLLKPPKFLPSPIFSQESKRPKQVKCLCFNQTVNLNYLYIIKVYIITDLKRSGQFGHDFGLKTD